MPTLHYHASMKIDYIAGEVHISVMKKYYSIFGSQSCRERINN